jgi:hypothetical protein
VLLHAAMRTLAAAVLLSLATVLAAPAARAAGSEEILARAEKKLDAGDFAGARKDVEQGLKTDAAHGGLNALAARIRFFYGDDEGAKAALAKASKGMLEGVLEKLLEGPFSARLGENLPKFSGRTRGGKGHYYLQTDVGSRGDLKKIAKGKKAPAFDEIAGLLEQVYAAYSGVFQGERDAALVSRVFVFADRDYYVSWSKAVFGQDASDAAAYYDPNLRILAVDADGDSGLNDYGRHCMFHEGFHQFLHYYLPTSAIPYWFNEGVAEFFGPTEIVGGKPRIGGLQKADGRHVTTFDAAKESIAQWTPLADLLRMDRAAFMEPSKAFMHYAQSWALVHYLTQSDAGKKMIVRYYDLLRDGKSRDEAYEAVFAKSIADLEARVKDHVRGLRDPGKPSTRK